MWLALALSLLIIAYNNVANRWGSFHGTAYVPANLTFTGAMTLIVVSVLELSRAELGFQGAILDAGLSLAVVGVIGLGAFMLARSRHAHRIADKRVAGLRGGPLAYHVLLRIPLGTAVAEEVLFRGVLFAVWRDAGVSTLGAGLCSSLAFGLWHISPTILGIRTNDPGASPNRLRAAVVGAIVATTVVGLGLTWVRLQTGGLVAPILLHAGINSVSALAAVKAGRQSPHY